jgi:hypothetical protein
MPRMDQSPPESKLVKLLLVADGKVGKSRFAGEAAKHFKTLYIDGDVAIPTLSQLPNEVKRNLYLLPAHDSIDGGSRDTRFCDLIQEFTTTIKFRWNDTESRLAKPKDTGEIWEITPAKMDHTSLLVFDSWTALCESVALKASINNGVTLTDATMNEMRPVYQVGGNITKAVLQVIRALKCHVIVLAHPDEYQHRVAPPGRKMEQIKEKDMLIDWTKMIPMSTSRPASLNMSKYFTDIAWMEVSPTGTRKLDFRVKETRVAGGHFDGYEDTTVYSFANLVRQIGGEVPDGDQSVEDWLKVLTPEEAAPPENKVLEGGESGAVKAPGMTSMFAKKAAVAPQVNG